MNEQERKELRKELQRKLRNGEITCAEYDEEIKKTKGIKHTFYYVDENGNEIKGRTTDKEYKYVVAGSYVRTYEEALKRLEEVSKRIMSYRENGLSKIYKLYTK